MTFHLDGQQPAMAAMSLCGHYAVDAGRVDMDRAIIRGVARERDGGGVA